MVDVCFFGLSRVSFSTDGNSKELWSRNSQMRSSSIELFGRWQSPPQRISMLATSCRPPYQGELGATWITVTALVHRYHRSTNIKVYRGILIYNIYIHIKMYFFGR